MSDWAKYLESKNLWHTLCGQKVPNHEKCDECWGLFWEKYKKVNPGHEVFSRAARKEINLKKTAALLLHGDEGRSLKKSAILIVACHSVLGYGLTTSSASCKKEPHKLNYQRPTWTTRFLNAVVPKVYYSHEDGDRCFQQILGAVAEDLRFLYEHGVQGPHGTHYYCVVNIVGDWPWLVKSGCLGRSFHNVSRHGNTSEMQNHQMEFATGAVQTWETRSGRTLRRTIPSGQVPSIKLALFFHDLHYSPFPTTGKIQVHIGLGICSTLGI